jgi:polyisoprenoid-binding protein YceI
MVADTKETDMTILAESSATVIPAGTWKIDPVWSSLEFEVRKLGVTTIKGRAAGFTGTVHGGATPSIEGAVDATTLTTFGEERDAHLQSPDFFDTQRYPELRFTSTAVAIADDEVVVAGDLTIKGTTKPIELRGTIAGPANDPWGGERVGIELEGTVDRTEFGLEWNAPLPGGGFLLPDTVTLRATLAAVRTA